MSFSLLKTNHTSFTVSDLDKSIAFFCECLGFELLSRAPRDPAIIQRVTGVEGAEMTVAFVQGPDHRVELIEYSAPDDRQKVQSRPCDPGFAHIAFDVDDVDEAIREAKQFGVEPLSEAIAIDRGPNTGGRVVYLRDHDGITFEFIQLPDS